MENKKAFKSYDDGHSGLQERDVFEDREEQDVEEFTEVTCYIIDEDEGEDVLVDSLEDVDYEEVNNGDINKDEISKRYTHFKIGERKNQKGYELYLYKPNKLGEFTVEENESIYFEEVSEVLEIMNKLTMVPNIFEEEIES